MSAATEIQAKVVEGKKDVETFVRKQLALVQNRFEGVSGKLRGQVVELRKNLEHAPKDALDKVRALIAKAPLAKVEKAVQDGVKKTEEAARKIGFGKLADSAPVKELLATIQKRIAELKAKVEGLVNAPEAPAAPVEAAQPTISTDA